MGEEVNSPKPEEDDDLSHLFTLDSTPTHVSDDLDIPVYSSKFKTLKEKVEENEDKIKEKKNQPPKMSCWNCNGDHNLRDCKEKRNYAVIAQKRAEKLQQTSRFVKASRYHTDEEQKHAHLEPGKISEALRKALGLRPDQAPLHVYKMRELGYPPGWVEEAKISHSGLSMFDSQGQEVKDRDLEDGEVVTHEDRDKYDFRKLIEYPGFNVPFEDGTIDETEVYGVHPMREIHGIKHMLHLWSGKKMGSYKRKKMTVQSTPSGSDANPSLDASLVAAQEEDMELDADGEEERLRLLPPTDDCRFIPPLPDSNPKSFPTPPPPPGVTPTSSPAVKGTKRKSLDEEESCRAKIPKPEAPEIPPQDADAKESDEKEIKEISFQSPNTSFNGRVKSVYSGTPVITNSEFKFLPSPEKFSKNICDVINFENLPNATGKYEQMRGLVKKVRDYVSLSNLKSDDSDDDDDDCEVVE